MPQHRLRREIIATVVVNDMVNKAGTSFDHRMLEETGAAVPDAARAHVAAARRVRHAGPVGRDRHARRQGRRRTCSSAVAQPPPGRRARRAVAAPAPAPAARDRRHRHRVPGRRRPSCMDDLPEAVVGAKAEEVRSPAYHLRRRRRAGRAGPPGRGVAAPAHRLRHHRGGAAPAAGRWRPPRRTGSCSTSST